MALGAVVAYAIFTQRISGRTDQDGTAPAAAAASRILVPFNNSPGAVTTMAIANPTLSSVTVNVGIRTAAQLRSLLRSRFQLGAIIPLRSPRNLRLLPD
jgi:hypothetical protein